MAGRDRPKWERSRPSGCPCLWGTRHMLHQFQKVLSSFLRGRCCGCFLEISGLSCLAKMAKDELIPSYLQLNFNFSGRFQSREPDSPSFTLSRL